MVPKKSTQNDWVVACSKHLVNENFKFLETQAIAYGQPAADALLINFIACFIGATLYRTLTTVPENIKKDKHATEEYLLNAFGDIKLKMQDAVAAGFTGAMGKFTGQDVEYYATIKPTGPVINKLPC